MSVVSSVASVVQLIAVGKELVDLFQEGVLTEEQFLERWARNSETLVQTEDRWRRRQEERAKHVEKV